MSDGVFDGAECVVERGVEVRFDGGGVGGGRDTLWLFSIDVLQLTMPIHQDFKKVSTMNSCNDQLEDNVDFSGRLEQEENMSQVIKKTKSSPASPLRRSKGGNRLRTSPEFLR